MKHFIAGFFLCLSATPTLALDDCLVGSWRVDGADMARMMASQTGGSVNHLGGSATLEISAAGAIAMRANDLVFQVEVPDAPSVSVTVSGYSNGTMTLGEGGAFSATASDYSLVGSADVLGQRMEIPVQSGTAGWGTSSGSYACSASSVTFEPAQPGSFPRVWTRG